ncbi:MAG: hypothetical protein M1460_02750 [Candidatus Thermoplasmatota archaeon]|nr:hypothetical protein [Candidatus Thermoplasmatota archaeon]
MDFQSFTISGILDMDAHDIHSFSYDSAIDVFTYHNLWNAILKKYA